LTRAKANCADKKRLAYRVGLSFNFSLLLYKSREENGGAGIGVEELFFILKNGKPSPSSFPVAAPVIQPEDADHRCEGFLSSMVCIINK
jgi:hypothetical protein